MNVPAKCKFCGKGLNLEIADDCPPINLRTWVAMAACNRCADYRESFRGISEKIRGVSWMVMHAKNGDEKEKARLKLVDRTRQFAKLVCDFKHLPFIWEPDFVDQLMEYPDKCGLILKQYQILVGKAQPAAVI